MTREEKVNLLNELLKIEEKNDIGNLTSTDRREFQQWVEDLDQTDTLDRIIAQIEQARDKDKLCEYPYNRCIEIIKKYMAESED